MEGRKIQGIEVQSPDLKRSKGIQVVIMGKVEENSKNNHLELKGIIYEFYSTSCHFKYGL